MENCLRLYWESSLKNRWQTHVPPKAPWSFYLEFIASIFYLKAASRGEEKGLNFVWDLSSIELFMPLGKCG